MAINSTLICLGISLFFWALASFSQIYNSRFFAPIAQILFLLPIIIFLAGFTQIIFALLSREKKFGSIAVLNISKAFVQQTFRVISALMGNASGFSLIIALAVGQAASLILFFKQLIRILSKFLADRISIQDLIFGLKRYKNFPLFSSWSYMLNILGFQLPVLLIGYFFHVEEAGFYAMAVMLLSFSNALTNAITRVLYQRAAEANRYGDLQNFILEVYRRLVIYSAIPFFLIAIYGRSLFVFIFGLNWEQSGYYSQIISPFYWVVFCTSPLGILFNIRERQKENSIFVTARLLMQFCGLAIGGLLNDIRVSLFLYVVVGILFRCTSIFWIMAKIEIHISDSLSWMLKSVFFSLLPLILWKVSRFYFDAPVIIDIAAVGSIVSLFYFIAIWHDSQLRNSLLRLLPLSSSRKMKDAALK
jgi:O-antigen/teichoic acid export membrane protein